MRYPVNMEKEGAGYIHRHSASQNHWGSCRTVSYPCPRRRMQDHWVKGPHGGP